MDRGELRQRQIAQFWTKKIADDLGISFMSLRRDLMSDALKPLGEPGPDRQAGRVHVLAGIDSPEKAT
jgi:hypothetical protein